MSQSIFALGTILGPSVGPTMGGILVDNLSWPWVFDVNLVPGLLAFALLWRYLRDNARPQRAPVDVAGIALLIVAVSCMQYVLDQGQRDDWFSDATIRLCTFLALAAGGAFVWWELRVAQPIVDLRVLRQPAVAAALLIAGAFAASSSRHCCSAAVTIETLGFTSTLAGVLIGIRALPVSALNDAGRRLISRAPLRSALANRRRSGRSRGSGHCGWPRHHDAKRFDDLRVPFLVIGTGVGMRLLAAARRDDARGPPQEAAKASSFIVFFFQLGGSISSAAVVAFLEHRLQFHQTMLAAQENLSRLPVAQFLQQQHGSLAQLAANVAEQAAALAYADAFVVTGVLALLIAPGALLLARRRT